MTEDDGKCWIAARFGDPAVDLMQRIVDAVVEESSSQNLIAASTLETIWVRHIVDSAQLLSLVGPVTSNDVWIDIGSGGGFPGLVIAALSQATVVLVEPRKRRAAFLERVVADLGLLPRTSVVAAKIQNVPNLATFISARAVASLDEVFTWSRDCYDVKTSFILPKGASAAEEVASVRKTWHGRFHVEHSITNQDSLIVLASGVARR